jgi:hypothetical protein
MFTEVKCYTLNTDYIVYVDKDDRGWTIHLSNGESLFLEDVWIADLKRLLEASPSLRTVLAPTRVKVQV